MRILATSLMGLLLFGIAGSGCASGESDIAGLLGSAGDAGSDASVGAAGGAGGVVTPGTCDPNFCVATGPGTACCVTANGPCGSDFGMGCVAPAKNDAGP